MIINLYVNCKYKKNNYVVVYVCWDFFLFLYKVYIVKICVK